MCAGTPNRDDRVSPAWVSACFGQLLCAGCGLGEHQLFIVSFGVSFLCIPLQTYLNPGSYCWSGSSDPWVRGLYYYRGLCKDVFNGSVVLLLLIAVCWVYAVSVDSFVGGWLFCVGG